MNREERRRAIRGYRTQLAFPNDKVVVGYLSSGEIAAEFHESLLALYQRDQNEGLRRFRPPWRIHGRSSANISRARNTIVRDFCLLDHKPEWLWLVDDDMMFEPDAVERMLAIAQPDKIIGGLCFAYGPDDRVIPTIFFQDELGRFKVVDDGYAIPSNTALQVYGTGAAFLLVHRDALFAIAKLLPQTPNCWFREIEVMTPNPAHDETDPMSLAHVPYWVSEDLFFCKQAHEAGLTVWVHTGVEVGHKKPHILRRSTYEHRGGMVTR